MPSAKPVPSADAAKDLHRPSGAQACWRLKSTKPVGVDITVTPPATAREQVPPRSADTARSSATSEDEHAESTVTAGPSRPKVYATRPDTTLVAEPVIRYASMSSGASVSSTW